MLGLTLERAPQNLANWLELVHADDSAEFVARVERVLTSGTDTLDDEYRIADGRGAH